MKSETFRKQALSLIIFFVAVAAVFFVASRLRGDPAEKQAQTILTQLLSSSDAVEPAADDSYTAAGSTITQDVPAQALGIARERQTNLEGWAEPKMEAYIAKKQKLEADQNK